MKPDDLENSLNDLATFAGRAGGRRPREEMSLGDGETLGGRDDAVFTGGFDDVEVVDLESRYTIEGTLGQGGMGAVLLATDMRLGRRVAIKRILGEAARSKTATQRFLTEAKAIAALNHPDIVQIYDYGQAEDGPFLIMEYVDGGSLSDRCKAAALPLEEAVNLACQLCDGLAKAHDAGIIHRDIKPANILLSADGLPKLTDFGLAKAEASDNGMTMTGSVMGTPDFMPPEQRRDASLVDHRSDLWSLAATVYQMVTGRSPQVIRFNDLPAALQDVLAKALEEEKDARYQSAREFRDALQQAFLVSDGDVRDLGDGECFKCGAFNEVSRRFCRECAAPLEVPCLSCESPMKAWESVCGQCGVRQAKHLEAFRANLLEKRTQAEGLLSEADFSEAEEAAVGVGDAAGGRFRDLATWAAKFVESLPSAREAAMAQAAAQLDEARKHEEAYDYASAVASLEDVPEKLRQDVLPDCSETVTEALSRVREKKAQTEQLYPIVREKVAAGAVDGLLDDAEQLLALRPDRKDLQRLVKQLRLRRDMLSAKRDDYVARAQTSCDRRRYADAVKLLEAVSSDVVNPTVTETLTRARDRAQRVAFLQERIRTAAQTGVYEGILPFVEEFLEIGPQHQSVKDFREKAVAYEAQQAAERRQKKYFAVTASLVTLVVALVAAGVGVGGATWWWSLYHTQEIAALNAQVDQQRRDHASAVAAAEQSQSDALAVVSAELQTAIDRTKQELDEELAAELAAAMEAHDAAEAELHQLGQQIAVTSAERDRLAEALNELNMSEEITNSIGMRLKLIPAGTFSMGSADVESDEEPVHQVAITKPFYLGVTEVTNEQWLAVMGDVPSKWKEADRPVEQVSWEDAATFCDRLSAVPAERRLGRVYRLPTEAEWEYACRAGTRTKYSFGDDKSLLRDFAWFGDNSGSQTRPVGQKQPNNWGLYDMHGNVWEWCGDWFGDYPAGAVRDFLGPATGSNRVLRGGSWGSAAGDCRSAYRGGDFPSDRDSGDGFRLALSPSGAGSPEAGE